MSLAVDLAEPEQLSPCPAPVQNAVGAGKDRKMEGRDWQPLFDMLLAMRLPS